MSRQLRVIGHFPGYPHRLFQRPADVRKLTFHRPGLTHLIKSHGGPHGGIERRGKVQEEVESLEKSACGCGHYGRCGCGESCSCKGQKEGLAKSHVAAYDRTTKSGALAHIDAHEDSRVKRYAIKLARTENSHQLHKLRQERFAHLPHWGTLDDHTKQRILDAEDEVHGAHTQWEKWKEEHGSGKGKGKADPMLDRLPGDHSGLQQTRLFKGKRVGAYLLRKSLRDHHIAYERHVATGAVVTIKQKGAAPAEAPARKPVRAPNGTYNFGEIPQEIAKQIGKPAAKIRLLHGDHTGPHKGYGLKHINAEHGKEIAEAGFTSAEEFVQYVATNFNAIYKGKKGRLALVVEGPPQQVAIIEVRRSNNGGFYSVFTAYPPKNIKFTGIALWKGRQPFQSAPGSKQPLHAI